MAIFQKLFLRLREAASSSSILKLNLIYFFNVDYLGEFEIRSDEFYIDFYWTNPIDF